MAKRILVVDDEPEVRDLIGEFLASKGFEVLQAGNGLEALLEVKRGQPAGVVLDIQMPRLGGLDALKRIRAFDPSIIVVIVSGAADPAMREEARAAGAAAVLDKPVILGDILAAFGPAEPPSAHAGAPAARAASPAPSAPQGLLPPQVLLVDDEEEVRSMLQEYLALKGYRVRAVPDAAGAVREIVQAPPDVVLLDIGMPGLSGADALPTIRALAPRAAVIMVSGSMDVEVAKRALAWGAFDYVTKPIDFDYLNQSVATALAMKALEE